MKKISVLFLFGLIVIPQVSLASWWNPFSWEFFFRLKQENILSGTSTSSSLKLPKIKSDSNNVKREEDENVAVLKDRIEELEKKLKQKENVIGQSSSAKTNTASSITTKDRGLTLSELKVMEAKPVQGSWLDNEATTSLDLSKYGIFANSEISPQKQTDNLSDEQKVKMTILAKEVIMSFRNSINFEKRATNEYLSLCNQKQDGLRGVISQCEQSKIDDQVASKQHMDIFYNGLAVRGLLEVGSSEGARLIVEEQAKEDRYIENNYNRCVNFARTLYTLPSSNYSGELKNWLSRLDKFENDISVLEIGLNDGITTLQEMLDYKISFSNFDTNFSRERSSIDALRRTTSVTSSNATMLSNQIQQNIDQAKKNLENLTSPLQNVSCVTGLNPATYSCKSLNGSQPFICTMGRFGSVSCTSERR